MLICNFTNKAAPQKDLDVPGWVAMHFDRELPLHTSNILAVQWFRALAIQRGYKASDVQYQYEGEVIKFDKAHRSNDFWDKPGTCLWDDALIAILEWKDEKNA